MKNIIILLIVCLFGCKKEEVKPKFLDIPSHFQGVYENKDKFIYLAIYNDNIVLQNINFKEVYKDFKVTQMTFENNLSVKTDRPSDYGVNKKDEYHFSLTRDTLMYLRFADDRSSVYFVKVKN